MENPASVVSTGAGSHVSSFDLGRPAVPARHQSSRASTAAVVALQVALDRAVAAVAHPALQAQALAHLPCRRARKSTPCTRPRRTRKLHGLHRRRPRLVAIRRSRSRPPAARTGRGCSRPRAGRRPCAYDDGEHLVAAGGARSARRGGRPRRAARGAAAAPAAPPPSPRCGRRAHARAGPGCRRPARRSRCGSRGGRARRRARSSSSRAALDREDLAGELGQHGRLVARAAAHLEHAAAHVDLRRARS